MDVALAATALALLSPILALVALVVRLVIGSPVLFRQERPGLFGEPFSIFKFRTMTEDRDEHGGLLPDAARLTRLGRFLRDTSLDELPELWNVLRGDMSLVGPRPLLFRYLPYFTERERLRLRARPGITGLAQVSGRNYLGWDDRLELDAVYVESMSLRGDLGIVFRTAFDVLRRRGVSSDVDLVETWLDEERSGRTSASVRPPTGSTHAVRGKPS